MYGIGDGQKHLDYLKTCMTLMYLISVMSFIFQVYHKSTKRFKVCVLKAWVFQNKVQLANASLIPLELVRFKILFY